MAILMQDSDSPTKIKKMPASLFDYSEPKPSPVPRIVLALMALVFMWAILFASVELGGTNEVLRSLRLD